MISSYTKPYQRTGYWEPTAEQQRRARVLEESNPIYLTRKWYQTEFNFDGPKKRPEIVNCAQCGGSGLIKASCLGNFSYTLCPTCKGNGQSIQLEATK